MAELRAIADAVRGCKKPKVIQEMVQEALDAGMSPESILNDALIVGMGEVGELFKNNEVYVPEVLVAARAMNAGMKVLRPLLVETGFKPLGYVAIGTVQGDLHDIGKNLVGMMLEGAGIGVIDLGIDVSPEAFVKAAQEQGAQILALSALLTTTMPNMKATVDAVKAAGLQGKVKVMIGGAPVTQAFADEIGADGYSADAASAADLAKELLAGMAS